jgi:TonB family protein
MRTSNRRTNKFRLLLPPLGTSLLLAALVIASAQAAEQLSPAVANSPPGWLDVHLEKPQPGQVAAFYQPQMKRGCLEHTMPDDQLTALLASDAFRFRSNCARLNYADATSFGIWDFRNPHDQRWPSQAIRMSFTSGSSDYKVHATVYCEDSAAECQTLFADATRMSAPQPPLPPSNEPGMILSGDYKTQWFHDLRDGWQRAIATEPCTPGPPHEEPPVYPEAEKLAKVTGTVVLQVLVNQCGDVRNVVVEATSHDRGLDRAAINAVQNWRMKGSPDKSSGQPHMVRIPVVFDKP